MAETSAISVIVPVYNVEQYLGRCLRSLTDQTALARMEIVLVDDGSTDGGGRMCDEFANSRPDLRAGCGRILLQTTQQFLLRQDAADAVRAEEQAIPFFQRERAQAVLDLLRHAAAQECA